MVVVTIEGPGVARVTEEPAGELTPGCVRVRTIYSGVSAGTELTAYRGTNPYLNRRWDPERRLFTEGSTHPYPVSGWGYQEVGEVIEAAPDITEPAIGSLVWGAWGHRSEAVLPADRLAGHVLPPGAEPLAAVFARVGAIALNAVHAAGARLGDQIAVFGQGVIGLLATRLAVLSGAQVVAADAIRSRLALSKRFGATETFDVLSGSCAEFLRERSEGADIAIELSGSQQALHEAIRSVRRGGRVVAAGFYQGEGIGLRLGEEFHHNQVQIVSSQIGAVASGLSGRWDVERLQRTFVGLVLRGEIDTGALISHVVNVDEAAQAFELLDRSPGEVLQLVFEFGERESR